MDTNISSDTEEQVSSDIGLAESTNLRSRYAESIVEKEAGIEEKSSSSVSSDTQDTDILLSSRFSSSLSSGTESSTTPTPPNSRCSSVFMDAKDATTPEPLALSSTSKDLNSQFTTPAISCAIALPSFDECFRKPWQMMTLKEFCTFHPAGKNVSDIPDRGKLPIAEKFQIPEMDSLPGITSRISKLGEFSKETSETPMLGEFPIGASKMPKLGRFSREMLETSMLGESSKGTSEPPVLRKFPRGTLETSTLGESSKETSETPMLGEFPIGASKMPKLGRFSREMLETSMLGESSRGTSEPPVLRKLPRGTLETTTLGESSRGTSMLREFFRRTSEPPVLGEFPRGTLETPVLDESSRGTSMFRKIFRRTPKPPMLRKFPSGTSEPPVLDEFPRGSSEIPVLDELPEETSETPISVEQANLPSEVRSISVPRPRIWRILPEKVKILEEHYQQEKYPDKVVKEIIREETGLHTWTVDGWFRRRRKKDKNPD